MSGWRGGGRETEQTPAMKKSRESKDKKEKKKLN
jgi:hypothetical protein